MQDFHEIENLKANIMLQQPKFRLDCIANDDNKVSFYYTGFTTFAHLKACYDFLGPAVHRLSYTPLSDVTQSLRSASSHKLGRHHILPLIEELLLVLIRLRLGLLEQDIAYRFGLSQSTVLRIITTWINFLYYHFKQL